MLVGISCVVGSPRPKSPTPFCLSPWQPTHHGRWEAARDFSYNDDWNGTYYANKRVRPIFVEDATEIVVVTVYTYFF